MIQTIRVVSTERQKKKEFLQKVRVYRLEGVDEKKAKILAEKLFCESVNQRYTLNAPIIKNKKAQIEIAYLHGVMNPESASILKSAKDLGITLLAVDSSWEYHFSTSLKGGAVATAKRLRLFNPSIEHVVENAPETLLIQGKVGQTNTVPIRVMTPDELLKISKDALFLNLEEMQVVQRYYQKMRRDPTDLELETIAQTWSEHCAHKTFKANLIIDGKKKSPLMSRIRNEALKHKKHIVSAFVDNSGVMDFYNGLAICGKVETHNSPSAIEPYGGAMTGSGGVFRDVLGTGLGAKTILSTDMFCFANPDLPPKYLPEGCLPPDYLLKRVVMGVRDYGNRMGIPTSNGSVHFHNDFRAKPTVIVGAYGLIPKSKAQKGQAKKGDYVVVVGGRTGRDGIHGATFSSGEMTEKTGSVHSSAVQIGNAVEEKRMFDAILQARDAGCIRAMQDCGAGGFSSAIGEMAESIGATIDLKKAPVKYSGLAPWEIWISESQERMALAIPKKYLAKFMKICATSNVEAVSLGVFDGSKKLKIIYGNELVGELDMDFLHHGLPRRVMRGDRPKHHPEFVSGSRSELKKAIPKTPTQWKKTVLDVLSHFNVASKEPIVRLYDHSVQGTGVVPPFHGELMDGPSDAAVLRPVLGKSHGMIVSHGMNPVLNNLNPYHGSVWAAIEALANYVSVGGDYHQASLINNYIWPFPDSESLWSLDRSVDAVVEVMRVFGTPVISGKDSLSSTYRGKSGVVLKIPPVLCISVFGRIPDVRRAISSDLKKLGSHLYLVGKQDLSGMGGSVYLKERVQGDRVPVIDLAKTKDVFDVVHEGIQTGIISSSHDISEGGLITTVFEMAVGGNCGADISIPKNKKADSFLFNETAGCFVVEIQDKVAAEALFKNVSHQYLGVTTKKKVLHIFQDTKQLFQLTLSESKHAWQKPFKKLFV